MQGIYLTTISGLENQISEACNEMFVTEFQSRLIDENAWHGDNILDDTVLGINNGSETSIEQNTAPCDSYFVAAFCSHYRCACNLLSCTCTAGTFLKIWISFRPNPNFGDMKTVCKKLSEDFLF